MRIATWNINGLRARLGLVLRWLEDRRPDLVGLQELKLADDQFPHEAFGEAGYRAVSHGQKAWNGVAVLARLPMNATIVQTGLPGQEEFGARLVTVDADGLPFTSVYVPNGKEIDHEDFPRKLAWLEALLDHFRRTHDPAAPAVLCGDFNICPAPLDVWSEEECRGTIHVTDEERARFRAFLEWGFRDLFREKRPDTKAFSWWDYRAGAFPRNLGMRLDFLLATDPVLRRVRDVTIDRDYRRKIEGMTPSDHVPVIADLG